MSVRNIAVLSVLMAGSVFAAGAQEIVSYKVGKYEVSLIVERSGPGNPGVLLEASDALKNTYIPGGKFKSQTNAFLIKTPDRALVVDTGFGTNLFASLKTLGVDPAKVEAVLLTHMHGDHIGGLQTGGKPAFSGASVYLAGKEKDYWVPAGGKPGNDGAAQALAAYGAKVRVFDPLDIAASGRQLFPGVTPVAAYGHTPGHTAFLIQSEGESLLIMGDLAHVQDVQFPVPDISVSYDTDPVMARESRKKIFDYAAKNKIPVTGMHLYSPVFGFLEAASGGGYTFRAVK